ncbi:exodeoxyribonuclease V subunit gamma, partial [Georgenia sp. 10Sc9-8]|nr:exodeoxyribonuclease V subunit gamma [Georgenia halotolerans]
AGGTVPDDLSWQPELWRRLRDRIGEPSPAERLGEALQLLTEQPRSTDLPDRMSVFGPTRLPEDQLRVLTALAEHRAVHLWLPHPSPALWERVAATAPQRIHGPGPGAASGGAEAPRRRDQPTRAEHPLLASMARDATELQLRLTGAEVT